MAVKTHTPPQMPPHLVAAMEHEDLTEAQLREIVAIEAAQFGLTLDEAIARARENRLPRNPRGFDLQSHIVMLLS